MWDLIKNDPILKTISIIILGIFAFSFSFSIMFGAGGSGMEDAAITTGYSAATGLGLIIVSLSKILIIVLLLAIIITAIKFIKKHVIGNEPIKGMDQLKSKPFLILIVGIGGILLLLLVMNMLSPTTGNEMAHGTNGVTAPSQAVGLVGVVLLLLKFLTAVSVMGLVIGLVMYFKNRYYNSVKLVAKETCSTCGDELKVNWKCCPSCGTEKKQIEISKLVEANGTN